MADRVNQPITSFTGDKRWLSNFWAVDVLFEGHLYLSVEHAYVAAKTTDLEARAQIRGMTSPGQVKRFGRRLTLRPDWEEIKLKVMEDLIRQKFQHASLRRLLLGTSDAELIEGNTWGDVFWGVCDGKGENNLGKILMKIRGEWMRGA